MRPDIIGHICNRNPDDKAARIIRTFVHFGIDGIIMIARIGRVDGDQGQMGQIDTRTLNSRRLGCLRFGCGLVGKINRNAMGMNGNQADGFG